MDRGPIRGGLGPAMTLAAWLNLAWMTGGWPRLQSFHRAARRVADVQRQELSRILWWNRDTNFGQRHQFSRLRGPADFQRAVPLATYDDLLPDIQRIGQGQPNVLTRDPVELLEPTSGTTRGEKLIPYTRSLRRQFQRAVTAWTADLLWHRPALRRGRAYWSVSPALGPPRR
ncbi:MAG: GH3 auxin-responsive promoter family protein, partial [Pirellulaceae bacterium]|nr:GH3 auxin-responsive promoter family protein [Pirellulaceae bacterium]